MFACPVTYVTALTAELTYSFVGASNEMVTSAAPIVWPIGTLEGHFAIIVMVGNSRPTISGWTRIDGIVFASAGMLTFYYKNLSAGDISSPPTPSVASYGGYAILIYDGATGLALKSQGKTTSGSITVAGFTRSASTKFVLAIAADRDPVGPLETPLNFTSRTKDISTYYTLETSDILSNFYDQNSVNIDLWAGTYEGYGALLEIT